MSENKKPTSNRNMHVTILSVIGIILLIAGIIIVTVHNPLRGSGLGTASIVLVVMLLIIAIIRARRTKLNFCYRMKRYRNRTNIRLKSIKFLIQDKEYLWFLRLFIRWWALLYNTQNQDV